MLTASRTFPSWKRGSVSEGDPKAVLVDVRTRAEWAFVGVPDLSNLGRDVLLIEWQTFPDNRVAADFSEQTRGSVGSKGS